MQDTVLLHNLTSGDTFVIFQKDVSAINSSGVKESSELIRATATTTSQNNDVIQSKQKCLFFLAKTQFFSICRKIDMMFTVLDIVKHPPILLLQLSLPTR